MRRCVLAWLLLAGCSNGGASGADVPDSASDRAGDLVGDGEVQPEVCEAFKVVGQPCRYACECLGGLCVLNEYAPFRFCSQPCGAAAPGSPCEPEGTQSTWSSLCVEFPSDFLVPPAKFCAPLCQSELDCQKLGNPWEGCTAAEWKGNPLYPASPDLVCISPSAQGHEPVDPDTCEGWEPLYDVFPEERNTCIGYCEFLAACKKLPVAVPQACCAFHCMIEMTPEGVVDKEYFKGIRCYVDNYQAFTGSVLVCTKPFEACGDEPPMPE
jgi:hypothetical protein